VVPEEEPETETQGVLHDNSGTAYRYTLCTSQHRYEWNIFEERRRIAYAWCYSLGDEFKLADWKIENEAITPQSLWARMWRRPEIKNYRRRGIGSQLLPLVISHARAIDARRITGVIASRDLEEFPALLAWYERFGFLYTPTPNCGHFVGRIELRL
jgi:GNAT superfamily N-acetyltransferase